MGRPPVMALYIVDVISHAAKPTPAKEHINTEQDMHMISICQHNVQCYLPKNLPSRSIIVSHNSKGSKEMQPPNAKEQINQVDRLWLSSKSFYSLDEIFCEEQFILK